MPFDAIPMTRRAPATTMTAAAALAAYDAAIPRTFGEACGLAEMLAAALRAVPAPAAAKPRKAKATGFRADLVAALTMAGRLVERRNVIPIVSCFLLDARGDTLTIRSTDMDMEYVTTIPAPGIGTWAVAVNAEKLTKLVVKGAGDVLLAPQEAVNAKGEGRLDVMVGESVSSLPTLSAGDFPLMSDPDPVDAFSMSAPELARIMAFVRPAVSTEEPRYYLNGVYLHPVSEQGQPRLRVVATDGHRLNLDEVALPAGATMFPGMIVPRKAVDVLGKLLVGSDEVLVQPGVQKVRFTCAAGCLTSKVVDGAFPDYQRVIPRQNAITYTLDGGALADAVTRISSISNEKSRSTSLNFSAGKVDLRVRNMDGDVAEESVPADRDPVTGDDIEIGFNAKYLVEAMGALNAGRVTMAMSNPACPIIIRDETPGARLCVLMPLRV